jgi:hypothetical protein
MHISLILFPNAPDFISALAIDVDSHNRCWRCDFSSPDNVADSLLEAGIASAEDASDLQFRLMREDRCPVFHAFLEEDDLTSIGFTLLRNQSVN